MGAVLCAKFYHLSGMPVEDAKGSQMKVQVQEQELTSRKAVAIAPTVPGGSHVSAGVVSLLDQGVEPDKIAAAFGLEIGVVRELLLRRDGKPTCFGWDDAVYLSL